MSETAAQVADLGFVKPSSWSLYWPDVPYAAQDRRAGLIRQLISFFSSFSSSSRSLSDASKKDFLSSAATWHEFVTLPLDFKRLVEMSGIDELHEAMFHAPQDALACLGAAAFEVLFVSRRKGNLVVHLPDAVEGPAKVMIRLYNYPSSFTIVSSIRADHVNRLITLRGTVSRASVVRPLVKSMHFVCGRCGCSKEVCFPGGRYTLPTSCGVDGCRSRTLAPNRSMVVCEDWQRIQVQGLPRDEKISQGQVPRPIDVELCNDLARQCSPGDVVVVTGIVRAFSGEPTFNKRGSNAKRQCLFVPYVEAVSVIKNNTEGSFSIGNETQEQEIVAKPEGINYLPPSMPGFTRLDLDFIRAFVAQCKGDQFRQLVQSLAPGICGMEMVKAGIILSLFGGVQKGKNTNIDSDELSQNNLIGKGASVPLRGDIHVLLVGDPGLGKSQLLQAAASVSPRGIYVCGSSTSSAGLTISVSREKGEFSFDAGAVVLADRGICCVDEFDKSVSDHGSLLGVMEQQEVSVAKAGLIASLPAQTAILAAANPVEGHYNKAKSLASNLNMSPAMVSRFDLVFVLLDKSDVERDHHLAKAIISAANSVHNKSMNSILYKEYPSNERDKTFMLLEKAEDMLSDIANGSLLNTLREKREDDEILPKQLMRKYIAYARQYVHPVLSKEASVIIKEYYLVLRQKYAGDSVSGSLPVTARQLESMVRMAEARARLELRDIVTAEDAKDVIEIVKDMLSGMVGEAFGVVDMNTGSGQRHSKRAIFQTERRRFLEALCRYCHKTSSKEVDIGDLYSIADQIELGIPDTGQFFEDLNEAGDILKKGGGRYAINVPLR